VFWYLNGSHTKTITSIISLLTSIIVVFIWQGNISEVCSWIDWLIWFGDWLVDIAAAAVVTVLWFFIDSKECVHVWLDLICSGLKIDWLHFSFFHQSFLAIRTKTYEHQQHIQHHQNPTEQRFLKVSCPSYFDFEITEGDQTVKLLPH
jgi:hypothetical protein